MAHLSNGLSRSARLRENIDRGAKLARALGSGNERLAGSRFIMGALREFGSPRAVNHGSQERAFSAS
jgi:hypothetical protein